MIVRAWAFGAMALAITAWGGLALAQGGQSIRIGGMCDRTGATKVIGVEMCPGVSDYIALVNRRGGVAGHRLDYTEVDHGYVPPRALEAYDRLKREGVVTFFTYGVPTLQALSPRAMEDRVPAFNSGTGRGDAIDGRVWPYIFPGTSSYWSQAGVAMKYLKDNGARRGTRIAYLYYDNPAGRDGIPMVEAVARLEGYLLRRYAVQPPGLDMEQQVNEISRDFRADWVITSLFGSPVPVSIKEFTKAGYPLTRVLSFVYGAGETDVEEAGWDLAQGYLGLHYAALGRELPVIREIIRMYRDEGREVPRYVGSAYYNRGVLTAATIVEGIRLAIQIHGVPLTGDAVRKGYEAIRNFDAQGLGPPLNITPTDHEGGGYIRVYQVKGKGWVPVTEWTRGYRDQVMDLVNEANASVRR